MRKDEEKDTRLESARPKKTPYCLICGEDMSIIHKHYMSRRDTASSAEDEILFMFECKKCNKRIAFWQDGTEWEKLKTRCEKCNAVMDEKDKKKKFNKISTTYVCPKCGHSYIDTLDLNYTPKEEPIDPHYEVDRRRFCIDDSMAGQIKTKANHIARLIKLQLDQIDHTENADVFDAIEDIKKLKITQLSEILRPTIEKEGYNEFKLGEPQFEREASVPFNCLDNKSDREEYDSKQDLQKLISKNLEDTNWRLMSDGVSYRLGYLSGRLRAYESEEELRKLVEQRYRNGAKQKTKHTQEVKLKPVNIRESCLVYFQNITYGSELIDKDNKRAGSISTMAADLHQDLRTVVPSREDDQNVPEFVRGIDFRIVNKSVRFDKRYQKKADKNSELGK
jgi:predicted RNA-binding Zn-ribbon protein involved in translation (DUF1610 family)